MLELRRFLANMDRAGRQRCYVAWSTRENSDVDAAVADLLGEAFRPQPSHVIVFNMLYDLGICADVEVYPVHDVRRFETLEEGLVSLTRTRTPDQAAIERLRQRFGSAFTVEDGAFWWRSTYTWALLSWTPRGVG